MENNKMQDNHEYEAKFFLENEIDFINKLYQLGFKETMKLTTMKRKIFGIQDAPKYFRVRDEGNKITMACKICSDSTIHGTEEYEITISDFNKGCKILELSGLPLKSFQETRRQIFEKDGVEIMIDEWPFLQKFIEIESTSIEKIQQTCKILGFDYKDAIFGAVATMYNKKYGVDEITVNRIKNWTFDDTSMLDYLKQK